MVIIFIESILIFLIFCIIIAFLIDSIICIITKNKIWKIILIILTILSFTLWFLISNDKYGNCIDVNWDIKLPNNYKETYSKMGEANIFGDGVRYHIFKYEDINKIDKFFSWENTTYDYILKINNYLDSIDVKSEYRPNYEESVIYYRNKGEYDELIIIWNKKLKELYIVEFFI